VETKWKSYWLVDPFVVAESHRHHRARRNSRSIRSTDASTICDFHDWSLFRSRWRCPCSLLDDSDFLAGRFVAAMRCSVKDEDIVWPTEKVSMRLDQCPRWHGCPGDWTTENLAFESSSQLSATSKLMVKEEQVESLVRQVGRFSHGDGIFGYESCFKHQDGK